MRQFNVEHDFDSQENLKTHSLLAPESPFSLASSEQSHQYVLLQISPGKQNTIKFLSILIWFVAIKSKYQIF